MAGAPREGDAAAGIVEAAAAPLPFPSFLSRPSPLFSFLSRCFNSLSLSRGGGGGTNAAAAAAAGGGESNGNNGGPRLKILLTLVDVDDAEPALLDVNVAALRRGFTLVCAFSAPEAARYLELFRAFESKPADVIKGRSGEDYLSRLNAALTSVRGVNKTDVLALGAAFGTAGGVLRAPRQALAAVAGVGPTKARRLADALRQPFFRRYSSAGGGNSDLTATARDGAGNRQRTQARLVVGGGGGGAPLRVTPLSSASLPPGKRPREKQQGGGGEVEGEIHDDDDDDDAFVSLGGSGGGGGGASAAAGELEVEEVIEDDDDDGVGLVVDE